MCSYFSAEDLCGSFLFLHLNISLALISLANLSSF
jgi:hypothetical protein